MYKYEVGIIGYFAKGKSKAGGQEAKTCTLSRALQEEYGEQDVLEVDTTNWKNNPFMLLFNMFSMLIKCKNIVILPAQNSLKIFVPFFIHFNSLFHRKIFYSVVGGWLPEQLKRNKSLLKNSKHFSCIFVETKSMKRSLNELGLNNIIVVPNFKYLTPINPEETAISLDYPFRLCTFSRVMKEKGIEDIINAVTEINKKKNRIVFELDIFGKIEEKYQETFNELKANFPSYIRYLGVIEPEKSVDSIKNYFALVFPTHYYTEGVPGTLIDACMAGVPVVCALWGNAEDVFIENKTGWGFEFMNYEALVNTLEKILENPMEFQKMRYSSTLEAYKYLPQNNIKTITAFFAK